MSPEGWGKFEVIKLLEEPKKNFFDVTNGPNSTSVKKKKMLLIFFK